LSNRLARIVVLLVLGLALVPAAATAAPRMWVGFQDDPNFRWNGAQQAALDSAVEANATLVRTTIYWYKAAPTRPTSATNPFDKSYQLGDVDELVRNAQQRGLSVLLTIWGTPPWANGGKGPNIAPTNPADLQNFARAVAQRYSGRYPGYPFVPFYSIWNEPNLGQFLSPQFDPSGKPVAPANYAKLARAGYAGIKLGSPQALVAIGETSNRGRDKPLGSSTQQDSESPGKFAQLVSQQKPTVRFDAWATHPYPTEPNQSPTQKVAWPNVTLSSLPRFEASLDLWFGRKNTPVWVTEYGHQTNPPKPYGVSLARQAAYAAQALAIVRKDPNVPMFVWFVLQDDPGSTWASGLITHGGALKPSFATFSSGANPLDMYNSIVNVTAGVASPTVQVAALSIAYYSPPGTTLGVTYSVYDGTKPAGVEQPIVTLGTTGWFPLKLTGLTPQKGHVYTVQVTASDYNGNQVTRTLTLVAK
jgi:hypothetical protein